MKNIKLEEFKKNIDTVADDILGVGEMYRVDAGSPGALVIMEEPEYEVMRDALKALFALNNHADKDGNLNINDLLKKHKK